MTKVAERHKWNEAFEWEPATGPFRRITDEQARDYDEQGFFVFEDALSADEVARLRDEIDPFEERSTEWLRSKGGSVLISDADAITFTTHLVKSSEHIKKVCSSGVLAEIAADLIGPDVRLYWDQAVYKKPEKPRPFPWHQDNGYTYVVPQQYLTCWIALTDATEENGCPLVVPGLHKLGTLQHWWTDYGFQCVEDPSDYVPAEAKAGSIVVFSSLTPHQTGPNTTEDVRKAYIVQYAPVGAEMFREQDGKITQELADDAERQFIVVQGGEIVGA
jgi:ectoine hydroxylase-related dioxygenase (phytanoyl-CoA dioxygenase family)